MDFFWLEQFLTQQRLCSHWSRVSTTIISPIIITFHHVALVFENCFSRAMTVEQWQWSEVDLEQIQLFVRVTLRQYLPSRYWEHGSLIQGARDTENMVQGDPGCGNGFAHNLVYLGDQYCSFWDITSITDRFHNRKPNNFVDLDHTHAIRCHT